MNSYRMFGQAITAVVLAVSVLASVVMGAAAAPRQPLSPAAVHCGAQIIQDLGSVRPANWSDTEILNCFQFTADPPVDIRTAVAMRVAATLQMAPLGYEVHWPESLGGWSDVGSARMTRGGVAGWRDAGATW